MCGQQYLVKSCTWGSRKSKQRMIRELLSSAALLRSQEKSFLDKTVPGCCFQSWQAGSASESRSASQQYGNVLNTLIQLHFHRGNLMWNRWLFYSMSPSFIQVSNFCCHFFFFPTMHCKWIDTLFLMTWEDFCAKTEVQLCELLCCGGSEQFPYARCIAQRFLGENSMGRWLEMTPAV